MVRKSTRLALVALVALFPIALFAQAPPSLHVHVDQFGYLPGAEKVAVLSDPQVGYNAMLSFTPGATLEVRDAVTDAVVFTGAPEAFNGGATHAQSGDRGWWFDFSAVTAPGSYVVVDPASGERSARFDVSETVYDGVLRDALRMFYYNRANTAKPEPYAEAKWTDGESFVGPGQDTEARYLYDQDNLSLYRDLTGGWFDAGDYNKYVTFAEVPVHDLLSAYEENPDVFRRISSGIPESGNGLPDVLDEAKWELDWLLKMSNPDGSVHVKMGAISYAENFESPPSANVDPRYYGPTCTAASLSNAGVLAHAALVLRGETGQAAYAQTLATQARACYDYAQPRIAAGTLETECDDGQIKAGDADRTVLEQTYSALIAAIYLRELEGSPRYDAFIEATVPTTPPVANYYWQAYDSHYNDALLRYMADAMADAALVGTLRSRLRGAVASGNDNYGWAARDLYRAHLTEASWHWGSNNIHARGGSYNLQLARLGYDADGSIGLGKRGRETLHYFHGVNPQGMVMLSNMNDRGAERSVDELYHGWFYHGTPYDNALTSPNGPAPGYVTGGPNADYESVRNADTRLVPPSNQPPQKSYLDENDAQRPEGGDNAIYAINEPAIYYQSAYVRLLANFASAQVPTPVQFTRFTAELMGADVLLSWRAENEVDFARYEVQRASEPGAAWATIGEVPAAGGGDYDYRDAEVGTGTHYYRLRMVDLDGSASLSEAVTVQVASATEVTPFGKTRLTPNPAAALVTVEVADASALERIVVRDASGRVVLTVAPTGERTALPLDLPAGTYAVHLRGRDEAHAVLPLLVQ